MLSKKLNRSNFPRKAHYPRPTILLSITCLESLDFVVIFVAVVVVVIAIFVAVAAVDLVDWAFCVVDAVCAVIEV